MWGGEGGKALKGRPKERPRERRAAQPFPPDGNTQKTETDCISPLPADKKRVRKEGCVLAHGRGYSPSQWQRYGGRGMRPLVTSRPQSEGWGSASLFIHLGPQGWEVTTTSGVDFLFSITSLERSSKTVQSCFHGDF